MVDLGTPECGTHMIDKNDVLEHMIDKRYCGTHVIDKSDILEQK